MARVYGWIMASVVVLCCAGTAFGEKLLEEKIVQVQVQADVAVAAPGRQPAGNMAGGIVLQENREMRRKLDLIQTRINGKHYAEAARNLGALLEDPATGDFFLTPDASQRSRRNFKAEVRRLIGSLPPEGRKAYEDQFGAEARRQLLEAVKSADLQLMQQVALRYSHTQAGLEALYLLAQDHMDHGRPREATACLAWTYESPDRDRYEPHLSLLMALGWQQSGDAAKAGEVLEALKMAQPNASWQVAGKTVAMFDSVDAAGSWLASSFALPQSQRIGQSEGWLTHRGTPSRDAQVAIDDPFMTARWRKPLLSEAGQRSVERETQQYISNKITPLPMLFPVAVDNTILIRTGNGVRAYDWTTGNESWSYPSDDLGADAGIEDSVWRDAAFGSPSTDGQRIFLVQDQGTLPSGLGGMAGMQMGMRGGRAFGRRMWGGPFGPAMVEDGTESGPLPSNNTLAAITIDRQGSLEWHVGGSDGGDRPALAGHFFLGPPLAYAGRLYCMAEYKNSIRLVVLDVRTGDLAWSQELGIAEHGIAADPFRRMAGATPSIAQGVIVCPTSSGGIVALDLATQSLLWAYQYPRNPQTRLNPESGQFPQMPQGGRWVDGAAVISGNRVLVTPLESNEIHCLNLADGNLRWTQPRADNLFLACVHNDKALMVGQFRSTMLDLNTGRPIGNQMGLPSGARPSGRGVHSGEFYYLPLTNASIAKIDLAKGAVVANLPSDRGFTPGNLIVHRGTIISQAAGSLELFDQAGSLKQGVQSALAADPNDPKAIARMAELQLAQGKLAEAIESFRRAHQLQPTPKSRNRLIAALFDGVQQKLPNHQELQKEFDALSGL